MCTPPSRQSRSPACNSWRIRPHPEGPSSPQPRPTVSSSSSLRLPVEKLHVADLNLELKLSTREGVVKEKRETLLQSNGIEPTIDKDVFAGHGGREVAQQVDRGLAHFVGVDVSVQGGLLFNVGEHLIDP